MRYLVLARKQHAEALAYRGMLEVAEAQDPAGLARDRFGADWLELVLAPEPAVHWVLGAGVEVTA